MDLKEIKERIHVLERSFASPSIGDVLRVLDDLVGVLIEEEEIINEEV